MKVKEWIPYNNAEGYTKSVGWLGGFFDNGMRWEDYLGQHEPDTHPYLEAIRESIIKNNLRLTGEHHQCNTDHGVPLFEDNTVGSFSWRAWGDLMAGIWSTQEDKDYSYMDFYM